MSENDGDNTQWRSITGPSKYLMFLVPVLFRKHASAELEKYMWWEILCLQKELECGQIYIIYYNDPSYISTKNTSNLIRMKYVYNFFEYAQVESRLNEGSRLRLFSRNQEPRQSTKATLNFVLHIEKYVNSVFKHVIVIHFCNNSK